LSRLNDINKKLTEKEFSSKRQLEDYSDRLESYNKNYSVKIGHDNSFAQGIFKKSELEANTALI
jgi:hypothetical protein